ncbi:MAG: helix-turn-helix domain-containing protein [bacterium]|nr:helix-turn-helix domain-containing protein [bacterium]MDI1335879.1 helix-turn-helix domain-containing protein [Lacunisphaera sp.]
MKSAVHQILPPPLRRSLAKFGADIALARRKRGLTVEMMRERLAVSKATYRRAEKGDPTVAFGVYAMALQVLGFGALWGEMIDVSRDEQGLLLDADRIPQRVRPKKEAPL